MYLYKNKTRKLCKIIISLNFKNEYQITPNHSTIVGNIKYLKVYNYLFCTTPRLLTVLLFYMIFFVSKYLKTNIGKFIYKYVL